MVLVVFLHSYNLGYSDFEASGNTVINLNYLTQNFISQGIARIAVPLFFFISGVLYYYRFDLKLITYANKTNKRLKTLLMPYVLWSIIGALLYLVLQINPLTIGFFGDNEEQIVNYSFNKLLSIIFFQPIPFQLWFLRDLFILILLAPIIDILNKYTKGFWLTILILAWFYNVSTNIFFIHVQPLLFFGLGGYIVKYRFYLIIGFPLKLLLLLCYYLLQLIYSKLIHGQIR